MTHPIRSQGHQDAQSGNQIITIIIYQNFGKYKLQARLENLKQYLDNDNRSIVILSSTPTTFLRQIIDISGLQTQGLVIKNRF